MQKSMYTWKSEATDISLKETVKTVAVRPTLQVSGSLRSWEPLDIFGLLLSLLALFLWVISLQHVSVYKMNDLGLISVLSPRIIAALSILMVSFGLTLQRQQLKPLLLALHVALVILILYGTQNLIEEAPRFDIVYRHAGYTEYIMRTGSVDPQLDAYFSWPGFFILSAFVTRVAGYQSILSYAGWAPVFYNLIYFGPIYMIFSSLTTNKRLIWLALWFFYLTNWIGQDYFSPQGLNFFLYLVIIAMLLKWFKLPPARYAQLQMPARQSRTSFSRFTSAFLAWLRAPDQFVVAIQPHRRRALLGSLLLIFALVVFSHPLTPFFVLVSVFALVIFRRCYPFWLPVVMMIMTAAWILIAAHPFLVGHMNLVLGNFGNIGSNVSTSVAGRVQGNPQHQFIALMRIVMTAFIWALGCLGALGRLRNGYKDITSILLALTPVPLIVAQNYGGEMFLRVYLFALPFVAFFAAALFYRKHVLIIRKFALWLTLAIIATNLVLLGGFLFTRYGNEHVDYKTYAEVEGVQYLYSIAAPHSLILAGWDGTPWQYKDYEKNDCHSLATVLPDAVIHTNVGELVRFIQNQRYTHTYLIFTRSQAVEAYSFDGLPVGALDHLEQAMLQSGAFQLLYRQSDAQIYLFTG